MQGCARVSLLTQGVDDDLINTPLGRRAEGKCKRQQSIELLILFQNLVILGAALVLLLHPAVATPRGFYICLPMQDCQGHRWQIDDEGYY